MFVPRQHLAANSRWDCSRVPAAMFADRGIAMNSCGFGPAQLAFAGISLHGHSARGGIFMNVDLDRRSAAEVPPGAMRVRL